MTSKLSDYLINKMSMTEVYQPVIIKELLLNNGECSKTDLAVALTRYDLSILEYYRKIVMRWPKDTLTKHRIISYQRKGEVFKLNSKLVDLRNTSYEVKLCEDNISEWIARKKNREHSPQAKGTLRYKVLKRANKKCELCGIPSALRPIDIDHIIPQSTKNKQGKVIKDGKLIYVHSEDNLQALCYKCNRAKGASDDTDFRRISKLVRDNVPDIIRRSGRNPMIKELKGKQYVHALNEKLIEEHEEYIAEKDSEESIAELADMIEVIYSLAKNKGVNEKELLLIVSDKRKKNGSFNKGYYYQGDEDITLSPIDGKSRMS